jgi:hypothetical protein
LTVCVEPIGPPDEVWRHLDLSASNDDTVALQQLRNGVPIDAVLASEVTSRHPVEVLLSELNPLSCAEPTVHAVTSRNPLAST